MITRNNSVQSVITQALCTACGGCTAACPAGAVALRENAGGYLAASVDPEKCANCGLCRKVCPSVPENQDIDGLDAYLHGPCLEGFIGYAAEKRVRREGNSGGLVTALLLYLLDSGKIDGAVTNRYDPETRRPKAVFSDSRQALLDSCGSYYTQSAVAQAVLERRGKRLAAVVLGCQAEALELFERSQGVGRPEYLLGLICAGQNSGQMIDSLIAEANCTGPERVERFRFKYSHPAYGGWPGNILLVTDRRRYVMDKSKRFARKPLYESYRCLLCYDQMCVGADLVCGDPWGIKGDHSGGETVVIARTEKGLRLLQDAREAGYIALQPLAPADILAGAVDNPYRAKVSAGFFACRTEGWGYPYSFSPSVQAELAKTPEKARRAYLPRLRYSRARCLAETPEDAAALLAERQRVLDRAVSRRRIKNKLLLPVRGMRWLLRKLSPIPAGNPGGKQQELGCLHQKDNIDKNAPPPRT